MGESCCRSNPDQGVKTHGSDRDGQPSDQTTGGCCGGSSGLCSQNAAQEGTQGGTQSHSVPDDGLSEQARDNCCKDAPADTNAKEQKKDSCGGGCCGGEDSENDDDNEDDKTTSAEPVQPTCTSGCCGDNTKTPVLPKASEPACSRGCCGGGDTPSVTTEPEEEACSSGCCGSNDKPQAAAEPKESTCSSGCCGDNETLPTKIESEEEACSSGCCGSNDKPQASVDPKEQTCSSGCCGGSNTPSVTTEPEDEPCSSGCCGNNGNNQIDVEPKEEACSSGCCGDTKTVPATIEPEEAACSSGCCGGNEKPTVTAEPKEEACSKGCCDDKDKIPSPPEQKPQACSSGCCDDEPAQRAVAPVTEQACNKGCCDDNGPVAPVNEPSCNKGCCDDEPKQSSVTPANEQPCSKGCCDDNDADLFDDEQDEKLCTKGCCDDGDEYASDASEDATTCCGSESDERCTESCIYAAAALQCGKACDDDPVHEKSLDHPHEHDSSGHKEGTACTSHLEAAFDQYSGYINQLRCICRSVLEQSATMGHKCCGGHHKTPGVLSSGARGSRGCSGKKKQDRWGNEKQADKCGNPTISGVFKPSRQKGNREVGDVEGKKSEAVSFIVSGMDCTSCADKLVRILGGMAGISQPRVNFVRGDGQFNLDPSITDAEEALSFATNASGFGLAKVVGGEFYLDILLSPTETASLADDPPSGVLDVQPWGKKITRVSHDPAMVGARDLYNSLKDRCGGLAPPQADPQLESSRRRLRRQLINTVIAAAFTIPVCVIAFGHNLVDERAGAIVCLVLATVVQGVAVLEFYRPALRALWYSHIVEMDMLVVMSVSAAYIYSVIAFGFQMAGKPLKQEQFFETSTLLITLILGGRLVAAYARVQAVSSVSLRSQQSTKAILVREGGEEEIDARLLQYGDRFKVAPHSRIPTDGTVVSGTTEVNESMVTGESMPVMKKTGDILIAGTINGDGAVTASLIRLPGKNTVTDIAQLVEDASNSRPKLQDLANKVASWFVPVMASIALVVFVVWIAVGFKVKHWGAGESVGNAVTYAVAVLAVACPCAVGLAVPMVIVIAGGMAARRGVIIKSADTTEGARKTTDVVFDKTGTITEGGLKVIKHVSLQADQDEKEVAGLVMAMVAGGKHPVSAAVEKYLRDDFKTEASPDVSSIRVIAGAGIEANDGQRTLMAGNSRWTKASHLPEVVSIREDGLTEFIVTLDSRPVAAFGLRTQIRPEAERVITDLVGRGITVHMVSGDQPTAVESVAKSVGISPGNVASERSPASKRDYVEELMADGKRHVMFCGDGTNDAVAVAQAHVGVQMGGGASTSSDMTQSAADVVLLNGLEGIPQLLDVSKAAYARMVFNFAWSAVYNVLAVTMASGAWVDFRIAPAYAGLGEVVSVVPVILAAMSMFLARF